MREPSPRASRLVLAGALAAGIVVGGAGFLVGRASMPSRLAATPPVAIPTPVPTLSGVMGRADLIKLAADAADTAAGGGVAEDPDGRIDGRRFEVRLPFGCDGPAPEGANLPMRWRYDSEAGVLRLHVAPVVWQVADWWPRANDPGAEAVEGFWIERPWTSSEACPPAAASAKPAPVGSDKALGDQPSEAESQPPSPPTLALGQVFFAEGPRRGRREGDAFETVVRTAKDEVDTTKGFRLRLSGRIVRGLTDYAAVCRPSADANQRPVCLISATIDEVAIENGASGEALAQWTLGGQDAPAARER